MLFNTKNIIPSAGRYLLALLILTAFLLQTFSKVVVITRFYADRDYIARVLCENKKNTAIHCGGTCQLNKRLKQQDKDSQSPERNPDNRNEVISSRSFYLTGFTPCLYMSCRSYPLDIPGEPVDQPSSHFHPPNTATLS